MVSPVSVERHRLPTSGISKIIAVRKTSDQTLDQSSETLQNVTEMLFAIGSNEIWYFKIIPIINSGTTPDSKIAFTVPSGATGEAIVYHQNASTTIQINYLGPASGIDIRGAATDVIIGVIEGIVVNGATAGNVQFQVAQNTSTASDTKVLTNSLIIARQIV